jgi:uncharacterized protein
LHGQEGELFTPPDGALRSDLNFALSTARAWFNAEAGCYKVSADQSGGIVTLRFYFPDIARAQHAAQFAALAEYIGWAVRLWPQPHQEALITAAREALAEGCVVVGTPALQHAAREAVVRVAQAAGCDAESAAATFRARTGWQLTVRGV